MRSEHVKMVAADVDPVEPHPHLHCEHCDTREVVDMPMPVSDFVKLTSAFVRAHKTCERGERGYRN